MTAFANKYLAPIAIMVGGTLTIGSMTWLVQVHNSYATSSEVAQAIEVLDGKHDTYRKRSMLQDNNRDLKVVRYKIFQQRKHNPDDDAEALQFRELQQEEKDLEDEKVCLQETGQECDA